MSGSSRLLIRADASPQMGTGHVMRCIALAQAWLRRGGEVLFVLASSTPAIRERLSKEELAWKVIEAELGSSLDVRQTVAAIKEWVAGFVVLDGYHFGVEHQRAVIDSGARLLFLDDYGHASHYCAHVVLNQNLGANEALYQAREPSTQLLLGNRYVLLRREFLRWSGTPCSIREEGSRLLVTMGGSDPDNITTRVIEALEVAPLKNGHAAVVIGPANPYRAQVEAAAARSSWTVELISPASDFPERMASVDLAISAAGTTAWELAFMGVPEMVVVLADNQNVIADALQAAGAAQNLGPAGKLSTGAIGEAIRSLASDPSARKQMSERARALIDGEGSDRVVLALSGDPFRLRAARAEDCRIVWEWSNEPVTRSWSFKSDPIPWEGHQVWFAARLASSKSHIYIAVDYSDTPVGQVRYELEPSGVAVVGVSLDHRFRGQGWGSQLLGMAARRLFANTNAQRIDAFVKEKNQPSLAAFEKVGYVRQELTTVQGHPSWRLSLPRNNSTDNR